MANLFDIGSGGSRIRYFVCKSSEEIIMNTLELITADEYLYRILINEGYERIVFLDEDVSAFSYDEFSKMSFEKVKEFEKENRRLSKEEKAELIDNIKKSAGNNNGLSALKLNNLKRAGTPPKPESDEKQPKQPMFGKRKVIWTETQWNSHVGECLSSEYIKTALVMPISRFFGGEYKKRGRMLTRNLNDAARTKNVVIFKLDNEDQFLVNWANDDAVRTMDADMASIYGNHVAGKKVSISDILKKRLINVSGLNSSDIANCILRLKYIESDSQKRYFANLNVTQSYLLGQAIFEHVENKKPIVEDNDDTFVSSDVGTRTIFDILKNYANAIVEEYKDKIDDEEWDYTPHSDVSSYGLERVNLRYAKDNIKSNKIFDIEEAFSEVIGLDSVKSIIRDWKDMLEIQEERNNTGINNTMTRHMMFKGNPGTGKTTMARIVADILYNMNILKTNKLVEVDRSNLVAGYVGQTATKTREVIESALDGVLFIDEAYSLSGGGEKDFGKEAIAELVKMMEDNRDRLVVILAGYGDEMDDFLNSNAGLKSRISNIIEFPDYTVDELMKIAQEMYSAQKYELDEAATDALRSKLEAASQEKDFGNGRYVRDLMEESIRKQNSRLKKKKDYLPSELDIILAEDINAQLTGDIDTQMKEKEFDLEAVFNKIIGLDTVKEIIRAWKSEQEIQKKRKENGLPVDETKTMHMMFTGNPGTGKTTMARIVADILYNMNILKTNKLVEVTRADLVGKYVGESAPQTRKKIEEALDGVLFIDEAYSLSRGGENDFGKEVIDELVKMMDENRDRLVVILAGYGDEMNNVLDSNAGLKSRISNIIEFPDYTVDELMQIAQEMYGALQYELDEEATDALRSKLEASSHEEHFGNGRTVRNIYEKSVSQQALRLSKKEVGKEELTKIIAEDINGIS